MAHADFRWYFAGNVCSNMGTWLQNTAQLLLAYRLTESVFAVGLVTCAQFASPLLVGPWAGALADRMDHRRLLLVTQSVSAAVAAGLAVLQGLGLLTQPLLVAGAFLIGLAFTFTLPAQTAFVPGLVPERDVSAAMALNGVSFNVGRTLAPILGIGVVVAIGFEWAFALNAISFLAMMAALLVIRSRTARTAAESPRIMEGFRAVRDDRRIQLLLLMVAVSTVATDPVIVLGPALAHDVFGVPDLWAGYFIAALGAGHIVGALLPTGEAYLRRAATCVGLLGLAICGLAVAPYVWVAVLAALGAGIAALFAGAYTQTLLLQRAGPRRACRVMAVWVIAFAGSRPIASLADGWIAGAAGPRTAALVLALPALAVGALALPQLVRVGRPLLAGAGTARQT